MIELTLIRLRLVSLPCSMRRAAAAAQHVGEHDLLRGREPAGLVVGVGGDDVERHDGVGFRVSGARRVVAAVEVEGLEQGGRREV